MRFRTSPPKSASKVAEEFQQSAGKVEEELKIGFPRAYAFVSSCCNEFHNYIAEEQSKVNLIDAVATEHVSERHGCQRMSTILLQTKQAKLKS